MKTTIQIYPATSPDDIATVRKLFSEYGASLKIDLSYQGFADELASLPGAYAAPQGRLLLASMNGVAVGCVAMRPVHSQICEMKRLYLQPQQQGRGLGRALVQQLIAEARAIGYSAMFLDTLPNMHRALRLYESLGFVRRLPYFESPIDGNVFMELRLRPERN